MTREHETSLSYLHSLVSDVFNLLEVGLLIRIEHQLLEVQSSQPVLNPQPRPRTFASAFPVRCRCWTGGCPCPWGQGIKSMPMRSSARQRKRSSRRPCRPHKSSCRGRRPWIVRPRRTRRSPQFSNAQTREASFKVAYTGPSACVDVTAADEAACEAAGAGRASQIVAATPYPPPPSPSPSPV
jgi:hypothetical protein